MRFKKIKSSDGIYKFFYDRKEISQEVYTQLKKRSGGFHSQLLHREGGGADIVEESNVLLMFLGGLPNEKSEIAKHWKKIFECSTHKKKFRVVVHPMKLGETTVTQFWRDLIPNILIVDDNHHVGTKWATRSLVDATLLMMQFARSQIKNIKKYVLLSSSCAPLFSLDDLYYAFNKDNKSWLLSFSEENGIRHQLKYALKISGGLFDLYHSNFFSQWMALDKTHVDLFFIRDEKPTYTIEKDGNNKKIYCGQTNKIIVNTDIADSDKKKELKMLLQSFESPNDKIYNYNDLLNPCSPTDEHFFGMFIYYKLLKNQNENDYLEILKNNITVQTYTNAVQKLNYLKKFSNDLEKLFYTDNVNIFCEIANKNGYNGNLFNVTDNVQHIFTPGNYSLNLIKKESIRYSTDVNLPGYNKVFLKRNNNGDINLQETRLDYEKNGFAPNVKANFYPVSSTYTNWDNWSPDPRNILRGLNLQGIEFNLNGFLTLKPIDALQVLKSIAIPNSFGDLQIKLPMYHPLEYTEWSLRDSVNAYIIMGYLKDILLQPENNWPQSAFKWAYDKNKHIICEHFGNYNEFTLNVSNIQIPFLECLNQDVLDTFNFSEVKIGNYIYPETITSAISSGALFIRKAADNCGISKYTDWICKSLSYREIQDYSCQIENCCVIKGVNNIFSSIGSNGIGSNGIGSSQNTNISGPSRKGKNMIDILSTLSKTVDIKETVIKNNNNFEKLLNDLLFVNNLEYNHKYLEFKNIELKHSKSNIEKIPKVDNYIEWDHIDYFDGKINDPYVDIYNETIDKFKKWLFNNKLVELIEHNEDDLKFIDKYIERVFYKYLFANKKVAIAFYKSGKTNILEKKIE